MKGGIYLDIQLKRGLLEICVLTVLNRGDSYGYQIIKDVNPYIEISESTLYPILKRLETNQCLLVHAVEHNGRLRKYYKITATGRHRIIEFIDNWKEVMSVYNFINEEMRNHSDEQI